mgnify:CR=1 FL=1
MTDKGKIIVTRVYKSHDTFGGYLPSDKPLAVVKGVGRIKPDGSVYAERTVEVYLSRRLSDDEIRSFHDFIREWKP